MHVRRGGIVESEDLELSDFTTLRALSANDTYKYLGMSEGLGIIRSDTNFWSGGELPFITVCRPTYRGWRRFIITIISLFSGSGIRDFLCGTRPRPHPQYPYLYPIPLSSVLIISTDERDSLHKIQKYRPVMTDNIISIH